MVRHLMQLKASGELYITLCFYTVKNTSWSIFLPVVKKGNILTSNEVHDVPASHTCKTSQFKNLIKLQEIKLNSSIFIYCGSATLYNLLRSTFISTIWEICSISRLQMSKLGPLSCISSFFAVQMCQIFNSVSEWCHQCYNEAAVFPLVLN